MKSNQTVKMSFAGQFVGRICTAALFVLLSASALPAGPEADYPDLRIQTRGDGMFYVGASELAVVLDVTVVEVEGVLGSGLISLSNGTNAVARLIAPAGAGFYFYAESINSVYTENNSYMLTWTAGLDMTHSTGSGPASVPGGSYRKTLHVEQDAIAITSMFTDPDSDYWFWQYVTADDPGSGIRLFDLVLDGLASGGTQAVLTVRLQGATETETANEHHARLKMNGNLISDIYWDGKTEKIEVIPFSSLFLQEGTNVVTVEGILDTGAPYSIFYIDGFDLEYDRTFMAVTDQLLIPATDEAVVTVTNIVGPTVYVADLTDPLEPLIVDAVTIEGSNGAYTASFSPTGTVVSYAVFEDSAGLLTESIAAVAAPDLKSAVNDAEYIVITVPDLAAPAQTLADYRQTRNIGAKVVMLEDIYDQFNNGIEHPSAIKSFLEYASTNWTYRPKYVVLAGSGTYDYRDVTGGDDAMVPARLVGMPEGVAASDTWYVDFDDDWEQEMAIGRLPAMTAAELSNMVSRIIAYEAQSGQGWQQTIVMCADDFDSGGNFHSSSAQISALIPGGFVDTSILMTNEIDVVARTQLIDAINNGALFVNYFGHGGNGSIGDNDAGSFTLLESADVASLTNTNKLTILTSMSCSIGRFEIPDYECLGEALVLGPGGGGAIAVLAPSSIAFNRDSSVLGREFYKTLWNKNDMVLGDVVVSAMSNYNKKKMDRNLPRIYNLLGDPGLLLPGIGPATDDPYGQLVAEIVSWKTNHFSAAELDDVNVSGDYSDADDDGLLNIVEYAFGRNPRAVEAGSVLDVKLSDVVLTSDYDVVIEYQRRKNAAGVSVSMNVSSDLVAWENNSAVVVHTQNSDDGNGTTETVRHYLKAPPGGGKMFVRMIVEKTR